MLNGYFKMVCVIKVCHCGLVRAKILNTTHPRLTFQTSNPILGGETRFYIVLIDS